MRTVTGIIGYASDAAIAERLHALDHKGAVDYLVLDRQDTLRRRLRAVTDKGMDCAIALPRDQRLSDGAVLLLEADHALVVRMTEERWLRLAPCDLATALELGYFCGNLHWRVRFQGAQIAVALEGPEADYLLRLKAFLDDGRARRLPDD